MFRKYTKNALFSANFYKSIEQSGDICDILRVLFEKDTHYYKIIFSISRYVGYITICHEEFIEHESIGYRLENF